MVSEWSDMSTRRVFFQWGSTIKNPTERVSLGQCRHHHHYLIKCNMLSLPFDIAENCSFGVLTTITHSLSAKTRNISYKSSMVPGWPVDYGSCLLTKWLATLVWIPVPWPDAYLKSLGSHIPYLMSKNSEMITTKTEGEWSFWLGIWKKMWWV
jgi:hypothetical protein